MDSYGYAMTMFVISVVGFMLSLVGLLLSMTIGTGRYTTMQFWLVLFTGVLMTFNINSVNNFHDDAEKYVMANEQKHNITHGAYSLPHTYVAYLSDTTKVKECLYNGYTVRYIVVGDSVIILK